jgi:hypothetical protein
MSEDRLARREAAVFDVLALGVVLWQTMLEALADAGSLRSTLIAGVLRGRPLR